MITSSIAMIGAAGFQGGLIRLVAQSHPVAKLVLAVLVLFSVFSWGIYLDKLWSMVRTRRAARQFIETFRAGEDLEEIYYASLKLEPAPVNRAFQAAYKVYRRYQGGAEGGLPNGREAEEMTRALSSVLSGVLAEETLALERRIPFLGTTASVTPFVGLFGTVFGIMRAFMDIGTYGSASIVAVAPGIAEALWTTAAGLAAAIPAVLFYNSLSTRVRVLRVELERYANEFVAIMQRSTSVGTQV